MENRKANQTASNRCTFPASIAVVIPAWQPGQELIALAHALQQLGCRAILVVDDGSGADFQSVFGQIQDMCEVTLLRHEHNDGKGRALKTGLAHFLAELPRFSGLVTADADGQHAANDIARVATALTEQRGMMALGCRMRESDMPFRSLFGNWLTRYVFRIAAGVTLTDTQTGLRGFPRELVPELLAVRGDRYEYEMAVLMHYCQSGHRPVEVPIRAIYQDGNSSSHFRPVRDSIRVYQAIMGYCLHHRANEIAPMQDCCEPE